MLKSRLQPDAIPAGNEIRAVDLRKGDVVEIDDHLYRVLAEPLSVHRGWSIFDDFSVGLSAPVEQLHGDNVTFRKIWEIDEIVMVRPWCVQFPDGDGELDG
jgi:hypothetical protein